MILLTLLAMLAEPASVDHGVIVALAKMKPSVKYSTDGAADVSVMALGQNQYGVTTHPPAELARIVALRQSAIPILISHLDDTTPTLHRFSAAPSLRVPLGFVCLDILVAITEGPMHVQDCADDGFGACVTEGYFFRPDSSRQDIAKVKKKWERLLAKGHVRFVFPSWWAGG